MKKIFTSLLFLITSFLLIENVSAESFNVYTSTTNPTIGSNVVITIKYSDLAGYFNITSSNKSVLSGGASNVWLDSTGSATETYIFKANAIGTSTITVSGLAAPYSTGQDKNFSKSFTINVKAKPVVVLSSDNSLASLAVDGYSLSPEFNRDTLEYMVELQPETTKINIVANPNQGGATISGAGERDVIDGDNRLEIVVTAENGSQRTYVINANVKEYDPVIVKVNNKDYTVIRKKSSLTSPNNYQETTVMINDNEVPAFTSEITNLTLVGLKDEAGTPNLYVKENDKYTLYKEYSFNKVVLYPMEYNDYPTNYKKIEITYNDEKITAYKTKASSNYALIYGMNVETGETNLYMYDSKEDTLQIYNREEIALLEEENALYLKVIIGLGILSFVLLITTIIVSVRKRKTNSLKEDE